MMTTKLDRLLFTAAEHQQALDSMPARKLSATAFLRQALLHAGCEETDLDRLAALIEKTDVPEIFRFLRRVGKVIADGQNHQPDAKWSRLVGAFGTEGLEGQTSLLGASIPEIYALACRAVCRKKPEIFGQLDNLEDYDALIEEHKEQLAEIFAEMELWFTGQDLHIDRTSLTQSQRDAGLAKLTFRRAPDVPLVDGWPQVLLRAVMDKSNKKAKAA